MSNKNRPLVIIIFLALLALPVFLQRREAARKDVAHATNTLSSLERYGLRFEEVASQSGVKFTHTSPRLDPKLDHILTQIASMGAGVAVADFDRDGWNDFYLTNSGEGSKNALYRNNRDGTFDDVAAALGVADLNENPPAEGVSMGAVWGDYNGDGYEDLLVYRWGKSELFKNEAGKAFTRVTRKANLPDWVNANNAIWLDYDRDGKLDLFLAGYFPESVNLWKLRDTRMMPESFEYAKNGGRKYLLRNKGDGSFEDVTEKAGLQSRRWALAAVAADLRGTGYPDIVIANDYGVTEFFANDKGKFREIGRQTGVGFAPKSGMNAALGDVLNSGRPAIYVSNITEPNILNQRNNLWVPREGAQGDKLRYDNMADAMNIGDGGWSFGAQFGDLNNDGALDLYLTNGYISGDRQQNYWYDYSKITGANSALIADAKNWPPIKGRSLSGYQNKRVWINDGAGSFTDIALQSGVRDTFDGRAVAMADLWNRGVLDVIVANQNGPALIYRNTVAPDNNWLQLELEGKGANRAGIGARVTLFWNGKKQTQFVTGGEGFCAQNQRRLHFGLGKNGKIEKAEILWPDGAKQTVTKLEPNQLHRIVQPATSEAA